MPSDPQRTIAQRQAIRRVRPGAVILLVANTLLAAACGSGSSGPGASQATEVSTTTTGHVEDTTTTVPPTEPSPEYLYSGTQTFSYASDRITLTIETGAARGPDLASGVECGTDYAQSAPPDTYMLVPVRVSYTLESEIAGPVRIEVSGRAASSWANDPQAADYNTYSAQISDPSLALELSDGFWCADSGSRWVNSSSSPGTPHRAEGYVVFQGAIDRYHPDGDPRLPFDTWLTFDFSVDDTPFSASPIEGELACTYSATSFRLVPNACT
jgi:hypothetical protein